MPAKEAQRHHFIPQLLLRNFTSEEGTLWFWRHSMGRGEVKRIGPKNLFVEKDLYTFIKENGEKDIALEKRFSRQEELMAEFLRQLLPAARSGIKIRLEGGALRLAPLFFFYLTKRSPGYVESLLKESGLGRKFSADVEALKAQERLQGSPDDHDSLEGKLARNAIVFAQAQAPSPEALSLLAKQGLAIYRTPSKGPTLVIGDVPGAAAAFCEPQESASGKLVFYPVAPDIALGYTQAQGQVSIVDLTSSQVLAMNTATASRSSTIAGARRDELSELSKVAVYEGPISAMNENFNGV